MAHIYWTKKNRVEKKQALEELMRELTSVTDTRFAVKHESDDSGAHLVAYIERNVNGTIPDKKDLEGKFLGWRLVILHVPDGWIKYVMMAKKYED